MMRKKEAALCISKAWRVRAQRSRSRRTRSSATVHAGGAHGVSLGKTLPAIPEPVRTVYQRLPPTAEHAAMIPCTAVLGAYVVEFER